jgi:hypothetical protein
MSLPKIMLLNQYMGMSSLLVTDTWRVQYAALHSKKATVPLTVGTDFFSDPGGAWEAEEEEEKQISKL